MGPTEAAALEKWREAYYLREPEHIPEPRTTSRPWKIPPRLKPQVLSPEVTVAPDPPPPAYHVPLGECLPSSQQTLTTLLLPVMKSW